MELQTEILENRIARLTVEIEAGRLEQAKREAARRLSRQVTIPGFRKGKAPYNVVQHYLGEGAILEEAVDQLGPDLYREALEQSELEPYGPGELEKIEADPLRLIFTLPLEPSVELSDYRALRLDFEQPEVTDAMVSDALKALQNTRALIEPKDGPAATGDQVKLDLYGELLADDEDGEESAEATQGESEQGEATPENGGEDENGSGEDAVMFDEEEWVLVLGDEDTEPMPGFSAQIEGMAAGEEREFRLAFPDDPASDYDESLLGKTVEFSVECLEVAYRYVPPLNDDFAKQATNGETETLLELRVNTRKSLEQWATRLAEDQYLLKALDQLVEQARLEYPEVMVQDYLDELMKELEQNLRQETGTNLDDYLAVRQIDKAAFREQYRDRAIQRLKRSLVLSEIVTREQLDADDATIDREIATMTSYYGGENEELQRFVRERFNTEESREHIAVDLVTARALRRIIEIAKGEDPPLGPTPTSDAEEQTGEETVSAPDEAAVSG